jgi:hypothetical protein
MYNRMALSGLNQGRYCPAQFQGEDEGIPLLNVDVAPVVVVQLHHDAVGLLPAEEGYPGTLSSSICGQYFKLFTAVIMPLAMYLSMILTELRQ